MKNLAELYGLSPATMVGLAQIAPTATPTLDAVSDYVGASAPAVAAQGNPIVQQARDLAGTPQGQQAADIGRSLAASGALGGIPAALVKPPPPDAAKPGAAMDTTPQAPDADPETAALKRAQEDDQQRAMQMLGGGAPAQVRPAGWVHATAKEGREGYDLDPSALGGLTSARESAAGHGLMAADARHKAATIEAEADAEAAKAKLYASKMHADKLAELQAQKEAYEAQEMRNLQTLATEARAKVNPDQIWQERGSAARVMSAIAIGLGQFGALMRGGPNTAWQIVQHQIDANIDAQKQKIANAKDAFALQSNLYARNLQAFGDKERAVLATRMNYLDQVQGMLDMKRAEAKGNIADANYNEMQAKVMNDYAAAQKEFLDLTKVKTSQELDDKWKEAQVIGGMGQGIAGMEDRFVPDLGVYARTKEEAQKIRDHSSRTQVIVAALKDAQSVYSRAAKTRDPRELRKLQAELESIRSRAAVQQTVKEGQGAMSRDDERVNSTAIGLFEGSVWRPNSELENQSALAGKAIVATQQAHGRLGSGGQRGAEVYVRDAKGNLVPRAVLFGSSAPQRNLTDNLDDKVQGPKGVPQK